MRFINKLLAKANEVLHNLNVFEKIYRKKSPKGHLYIINHLDGNTLMLNGRMSLRRSVIFLLILTKKQSNI